jgi:ribosomal protein S18 acetylase RimI-like enzyme
MIAVFSIIGGGKTPGSAGPHVPYLPIAKLISDLLGQLSTSRLPLEISTETLIDIASSGSMIFGIGDFEDGKIQDLIGMATLCPQWTLKGFSGNIQDVVVNSKDRGKGYGETLLVNVLLHAQSIGMKYVDLTSKPEREVANHLYRKLGFVLLGTNFYRYTCR